MKGYNDFEYLSGELQTVVNRLKAIYSWVFTLLLPYFITVIPQITQPTRFSDHVKPVNLPFFFINFVNSNTIAGNLILHIGNYLPNFLILSDTYIVGKLQIPVVLLGSRWSVNNPISLRVLGFMKEESLIQV